MNWTLAVPLSPVHRKGELLGDPSLPTSLAVDPWIPPPPAAAPAAGGRGIHGSRLVHSVGVGLELAGGVLEAEMSSAGVWFAGGGSPLRSRRSVELRRRSVVNLVLVPPWRCRGRLPRVKLRGRRSLQVKILKKKMRRIGSTAAALDGVGPLGPALGDFPLAWGLPPIQGFEGGSGGGAPPTATACRRRGQLAEGRSCNFVFVGVLSVISPV